MLIVKNIKCALFALIALLVVSSIFFAYTNISSGANREFAEADDFPRGALVYAQFRDLPALVQLWDESALKQKYLRSQNFAEFQNRHLALKLVSRWQEFNAALGFELDAAKIAEATDNRAAIAVYDIGKLELVFIAPLADEKFAATLFFQNQTQFEENTLPDGGVYYSREVEADRGRQKQQIAFANVKGRFILATSEDLLLRTLANINGKSPKERLSDEPEFSSLAAKTTPHLATVWVNQAKLNEDWYFKHYWILQNFEQIKNIRAGIFDFEMPDGKLVERRAFLLKANRAENSAISATEAEHVQTLIPANAAFFKIHSVAGKAGLAGNLILETIMDKLPSTLKQKRSQRWNSYDSFSERDESDYYDYAYLGSNFDQNIDENETDDQVASSPADLPQTNQLEQILAVAGASSVASVAAPQVLPNPLFVEFRRATIFNLRAAANFNQTEFENAVSGVVQNRLAVANSEPNLIWETKSENGDSWRELNLPALGWGVSYALRKNDLIIANQTDLLKSVLDGTDGKAEQNSALFNELTVIRLSQRENAFDGVMQKLKPEKQINANQATIKDEPTSDFLTGNIGSLLDTLSDVDRIEIGKNHYANYSTEEVTLVLK